MRQQTRRNVLKAGGLVASGLAVSGGVAAITNRGSDSADDSAPVEVTPMAVETDQPDERAASGTNGKADAARDDARAIPGATMGDALSASGMLGWDLLNETWSYDTDGHGNETGWTVEWLRDPDDASRQGVLVQLRMNHGGYANDEAEIALSFDPARTDVRSHVPGNFEASNVVVTDESVVDGDAMDVAHTYGIRGDLRNNTVRLYAAATTITDPKPGATFATVDLHSAYTDRVLGAFAVDRSEISTYYRYWWT